MYLKYTIFDKVLFQNLRTDTKIIQKFFSQDGKTRLFNGFKSPEILQSHEFLTNIVKYYPSMDLIISVRHPIFHFQSAYNFKYRSIIDQVQRQNLPEPVELIGFCGHDCFINCTRVVHNANVCTRKSYFHHGLSRLSLTPLVSKEELDLLDHHSLSLHPGWKGRVFLLEIGQLADSDSDRKTLWERSYEEFLGFKAYAFNSSIMVGDSGNDTISRPAIMNICDNRHEMVRNVLLEAGIKASHWIQEYLLKSDRVYVGNRDHFLTLIEKWKVDPCHGV